MSDKCKGCFYKQIDEDGAEFCGDNRGKNNCWGSLKIKEVK